MWLQYLPMLTSGQLLATVDAFLCGRQFYHASTWENYCRGKQNTKNGQNKIARE